LQLLLCCWLEVFLSFTPPRTLRKIFPPVVTGTTVVLIGFALTTTGFEYWGGGTYCASQVLTTKALCSGNGDVLLGFGDRNYIGLGFVVFCTLLIVELFGSPFLRNIQVVLGLLVGMIVASAVTYQSCTPNCEAQTCTTQCFEVLPQGVTYNNVTNVLSGTPTLFSPNSTVCGQVCDPAVQVCNGQTCKNLRYVTGAEVSEAKWITFLWVHTFNIGFYAPAILPMLFGFMITSIECIGDVTATTEASGLVPVGAMYERSVQGGVLADGLNCFFAALATVLPCTTYAQNNGVISLTRCGARRAGWACAVILFILGIMAKFAGVILTIPNCVLGGITTFLFINVAVSGMRILTLGDGINRRNRFIIAMALSIGMGVELVPTWVNISGQPNYPYEDNFWPFKDGWSSGYRGFRDALIIVLSTGFSIGGFIAVVLNLILPHDLDDEDEVLHDTAYDTGTAERNAVDAKLAMEAPNGGGMHREMV
jgi:xanthine/uracil permease